MKELIQVISAIEIMKAVRIFIEILTKKTDVLADYLEEIEAEQGEKE